MKVGGSLTREGGKRSSRTKKRRGRPVQTRLGVSVFWQEGPVTRLGVSVFRQRREGPGHAPTFSNVLSHDRMETWSFWMSEGMSDAKGRSGGWNGME